MPAFGDARAINREESSFAHDLVRVSATRLPVGVRGLEDEREPFASVVVAAPGHRAHPREFASLGQSQTRLLADLREQGLGQELAGLHLPTGQEPLIFLPASAALHQQDAFASANDRRNCRHLGPQSTQTTIRLCTRSQGTDADCVSIDDSAQLPTPSAAHFAHCRPSRSLSRPRLAIDESGPS